MRSIKRMLTNNLGLKLITVLASIVLWIIVTNYNDPVRAKEYDLTVTLANATTVTDAGMVYTILEDTDTVTVTVRAKRSVLELLDSTDLTVTADFNNITQMNTIALEVSCGKYTESISGVSLDHTNLLVELEEAMTADFNLELETEGSPQDGYAVGDTTLTPNIVTVSGPASVVEKVAAVKVFVSVDGRSTTMRTNSPAVAVDASGNIIDDDRLVYSQKSILANISFLETKSVSLKVNTTGTCADGYRLEEAVSSPTTVTIAGDSDVLDKIDTIELPAELLDITDAAEDVSVTVDISAYLPDNVRLPSGSDTEVTLTAKIDALETESFTIAASDINLMNTPTNMEASFGTIDSITILLSGTKEDLAALDLEDVSVSIDLSGLTEGMHSLSVIVSTPDNIYSGGETWVDVVLTSTVEVVEETVTE